MSFDWSNLIVRVLEEVVPPAFGAAIGAGFVGFVLRGQRRLFKNIRRPIQVIGTGSQTMNHEADLLRRVGLFHVVGPSSDVRVIDTFGDKRLVVVGFSPNADFRAVYQAAGRRELPIVVFAQPGAIQKEDLAFIQAYSHHSICNTPLRLISDVFAIMSTYPEDK